MTHHPNIQTFKINPPSYILKFLWHHFEYNAVIHINYKTKEKKKVSQMFDATLLPQIVLVVIIL